MIFARQEMKMKKCDLSKSALFQSAKIIVQNAENALKALTIQEIYVIIKLYNFLQKGLDRLCWLAKNRYIHTYSISLSFFKNIIEILKVHFTSLKRVNKVCLFVFLFEKQSFARYVNLNLFKECCL